jgi:hypothetical protein
MRRRLVPYVLLVASGCGPGGGGAIPFDQLANEFANLFCHKAFVCCDAVELQDFPSGEAECRAAVAADLMSDLTGDETGVAMGTTIYDGAKARACVDTVAALSCSEWGGDDSLRRFPDCLHFFRGTVAPGGACSRSAECLDGTCPPSAGNAVCVARAALGESCASNTCRQELYCALDPSGLPTTCAVPKANGMTCIVDLECASRSCVGAPTTTGAPPGACGAPSMCNGV